LRLDRAAPHLLELLARRMDERPLVDRVRAVHGKGSRPSDEGILGLAPRRSDLPRSTPSVSFHRASSGGHGPCSGRGCMTPTVGNIVGKRFELVRELGRGSMEPSGLRSS
jgi:hypothetical protein